MEISSVSKDHVDFLVQELWNRPAGVWVVPDARYDTAENYDKFCKSHRSAAHLISLGLVVDITILPHVKKEIDAYKEDDREYRAYAITPLGIEMCKPPLNTWKN